MSITDMLTSWLIGAPAPPFVIVSVTVGYGIILAYFYGTIFWDKIGFGERLIFAFLFGVPITLFDSILNGLVWTSFTRVGFSYDSTLGLYLLALPNIVLIGVWRLNTKRPLASLGTEPAKKLLENRNMWLPYAASMFGVSFLAFNYIWIGNKALDSLVFLQDQVVAWAILLVLVYPLFVLVPLMLLTSPTDAEQLASMVLRYSCPVALVMKVRPVSSVRRFWNWLDQPNHWRKVVVFLFCFLIGAYVPALDASFGIYSPQVMSITTSYDNTLLFTSSPDNTHNFTLVQVTSTYEILNPLIPYLNVTFNNPSNFSTIAGWPNPNFYGVYNYIGYTDSGSVAASYGRGHNGEVIYFEVQPNIGSRSFHSEVTISFFDLVTGLVHTASTKQSIILANGTTLETIKIVISNDSPDYLHVAHLFVQYLQANATYAGSCNCTSQVGFTRAPDSPELYVDYYVPPHAEVVATIVIKTPVQP